MTDPIYVDPEEVESNSPESRGRQPAKKMFGTTDLQKQALEVCGRARNGFKNNVERNRFVAIEEFAKGMDDESRVWRAWILYRIEQTRGLNTKFPTVALPELMRRIEGKDGEMKRVREIWFTDNRARVLKTKTVKQIAQETGVDPASVGMDEMIRRANKHS